MRGTEYSKIQLPEKKLPAAFKEGGHTGLGMNVMIIFNKRSNAMVREFILD